jgi:hypothetical protein
MCASGLLEKTRRALLLNWLALVTWDLEECVTLSQIGDLAILSLQDLLVTAGLIAPAPDQMVKADLTAVAIQQPSFTTACSNRAKFNFHSRPFVWRRGIDGRVAEFYVSGETR